MYELKNENSKYVWANCAHMTNSPRRTKKAHFQREEENKADAAIVRRQLECHRDGITEFIQLKRRKIRLDSNKNEGKSEQRKNKE